jgi:hypothetical protein
MRPAPCLRLLALSCAVAACGGRETTSPDDWSNPYHLTTTGPGVLTVSPLDTNTVMAATPLGMLAPPGHVLPTDHVYLYFVDAWNGNQQANDCRARPVRAAGSGVIDFVLVTEAQGDTKVGVQMTRTFHYYYDHVLLKPGMALGTHVQAGDTIATTNGRCPSMDLGVYDMGMTPVGLLNSIRYGQQTLHVVSPYQYFSEPLRSFYYAHVRMYEGVPRNKDGRVDWGVRGRLVGDWFHASLPHDANTQPDKASEWAKSISFAYDWFDNTSPRISIGGTLTEPGVLSIAAGDPDPATVSVSSGLIAYHGTPVIGRTAPGWVLVQMLTDERLRVEYFTESNVKPTAFTTAAQEYLR